MPEASASQYLTVVARLKKLSLKSVPFLQELTSSFNEMTSAVRSERVRGGGGGTGNLADGADRGTKCSACDLAVLSEVPSDNNTAARVQLAARTERSAAAPSVCVV